MNSTLPNKTLGTFTHADLTAGGVPRRKDGDRLSIRSRGLLLWNSPQTFVTGVLAPRLRSLSIPRP